MDTDQIKGMLGQMSNDAARVARSGKAIIDAAHDRLQVVDSRLAELRKTALADQAAGDEYQALIAEKGRLAVTIAKG